MFRIDKTYFREIKNRFGFYGNYPLNYKLEIGKIGYYDGWKARVHWITSLKKEGIKIASSFSGISDDILYSTANSTSYSFAIDPVTTLPKMVFNFSKKRAITFQKYGADLEELPIKQLQDEIVKNINSGLKWDYKWVFISHLWIADAFTLLMSGSNKSSIEISANKLAVPSAFNIADVNIGLSVTNQKSMGIKEIYPGKVQSFFRLYKLGKNNILKPYG